MHVKFSDIFDLNIKFQMGIIKQRNIISTVGNEIEPTELPDLSEIQCI